MRIRSAEIIYNLFSYNYFPNQWKRQKCVKVRHLCRHLCRMFIESHCTLAWVAQLKQKVPTNTFCL